MSWGYRIVRHPDGSHDLREVYFRGAEVTGVSAVPVSACWYPDDAEGERDSAPRASIIWQLERMLESARERPVVDMPADEERSVPAIGAGKVEPMAPAEPGALARSIAELEAWERSGDALCEIENEVSFSEAVCLCLHELKGLRAHSQASRSNPVDVGREGCIGSMTPERATYFLERFKHEEKLLGPHEQWAIDYAIAALAPRPSTAHALDSEDA